MNEPPSKPPELYTYVDELGRTITVYPPGYAEGVAPRDYVKPRGKRGVREATIALD